MINLKTLKTILIAFILSPTLTFANDDGEFDKFGFGAGISFAWDLGDDKRIDSASVVDGIVRVDDEGNGLARLTLEAHYFFNKGWWGHGPFIAIQPGTDEVIDTIGAGWMVGFRKDKSAETSFNLGFGVVADPNVSVLGDGIEANSALPGTETSVRFKEKTKGGIMLIFSTSF